MAAGAVRVTLPPVQNVVGPDGVMVVSGAGLTFTATGDEVAVQPEPSVTVTLYEPPAPTVICCVVAPFDQR